jgi:hypothetical protein
MLTELEADHHGPLKQRPDFVYMTDIIYVVWATILAMLMPGARLTLFENTDPAPVATHGHG